MIARGQSGFTLMEVVIVVGVVALVLAIAIPSFRSLKLEEQYTQVEGELDTLKVAISSYWRNNHHAYPTNITSNLTNATPNIVSKVIEDPWTTDSSLNTYGYASGTDNVFGAWFYVYTKGPDSDTEPKFDEKTQSIQYSGSGRVVSNAPIARH